MSMLPRLAGVPLETVLPSSLEPFVTAAAATDVKEGGYDSGAGGFCFPGLGIAEMGGSIVHFNKIPELACQNVD